MHKAYQPLKPATNKYLQKKWDRARYEEHRNKVSTTSPIVDTWGIRTPAHVQLKLKKLQIQDERLAVIERDNRLLSSKLSDIVRSKGLVDHRNHYPERSLNAEKRRVELLQVTHQNQAIYQRITSRESEYRRQIWLDDWERMERRRDGIAHYPRGVANKQCSKRRVKFAASGDEGSSEKLSDSAHHSDTTTDQEKDGHHSDTTTDQEKDGHHSDTTTDQEKDGHHSDITTDQEKDGHHSDTTTDQEKDGHHSDITTDQKKDGHHSDTTTDQEKDGHHSDITTDQKKDGHHSDITTDQKKDGHHSDTTTDQEKDDRTKNSILEMNENR